jgi:hypothetical protein
MVIGFRVADQALDGQPLDEFFSSFAESLGHHASNGKKDVP